MIDYTGDPRFPAALVNTSQEGGNMTDPGMPGRAMTAPGSEPASPNPGPFTGEHLPGPQYSNDAANTVTPLGDPMAVNDPLRAGDHRAPARVIGYHGWTRADGSPGNWREV